MKLTENSDRILGSRNPWLFVSLDDLLAGVEIFYDLQRRM